MGNIKKSKGFTLISLLSLRKRSCKQSLRPSGLKGFTLIELMVVISIIAVLIAISAGIFANLQKSGRDAKRKSDLATIQSALEQYHADQGVYPSTITFNNALTNQVGINPVPTPVTTYLSKIPKENNASPYKGYSYAASPFRCNNTMSNSATYCTKYCLYATLENSTSFSALCTDIFQGHYSVESP